MAEASRARDFNDIRMLLQSAAGVGELWHARDGGGRAAYFRGGTGGTSGEAGRFQTDEIVAVPKTTGVVLLDGGSVFWHWDNNRATFKKRSNSKDFFVGTAVGDAASADDIMAVNLNRYPRPLFHDLDLARDPFTTVITGTQALTGLGLYRRGGAHRFVLSSTSEAQLVDALGDDSIQAGAKGIVELEVKVVDGSAGGAPDFNLGLASATHATDADSIAQHLFLHVDGNSGLLSFQSKDGTNTQPATSSGVSYTAGTPFEVWLDMRNPASVKLYVDGVQKLSGTTFNVSAAASAWKLLAHLEKTAAADAFEVYVNRASVRVADQSVLGA